MMRFEYRTLWHAREIRVNSGTSGRVKWRCDAVIMRRGQAVASAMP